MIRVLIADDQPLMRDGLKYILEQDDEIRVVGCAENGIEAFHACERLTPDVVLMDVRMPRCDGIEGTRLIKESLPAVKVIIITTFNESEDVVRAMDLGADSYILKDVEPDQLILAVKSVAKGLKVIHADAFKGYSSGIRDSSKNAETKDYGLSGRELDIIRLIVNGNSNKEISANLDVTESVVRNTISGILNKLNLQDRTQLAVFSLKNKIV